MGCGSSKAAAVLPIDDEKEGGEGQAKEQLPQLRPTAPSSEEGGQGERRTTPSYFGNSALPSDESGVTGGLSAPAANATGNATGAGAAAVAAADGVDASAATDGSANSSVSVSVNAGAGAGAGTGASANADNADADDADDDADEGAGDMDYKDDEGVVAAGGGDIDGTSSADAPPTDGGGGGGGGGGALGSTRILDTNHRKGSVQGEYRGDCNICGMEVRVRSIVRIAHTPAWTRTLRRTACGRAN